MIGLNQKVNKQCIKSKQMRSSAWGLKFEDAQELRKQQQEVYKKFIFLKEMKKAIEKVEKGV